MKLPKQHPGLDDDWITFHPQAIHTETCQLKPLPACQGLTAAAASAPVQQDSPSRSRFQQAKQQFEQGILTSVQPESSDDDAYEAADQQDGMELERV
jgi:hypothetical protein